MQKPIYQQLLKLVDRPRENGFEPLEILSRLLDEEPIKCELPGQWYECTFPRAGVSIVQWDQTGAIYSLTLHILDAKVKHRGVTPYSGDLPYDIHIEDSEEEVERKCPGATMRFKDYRTDVDLRPLEVRFHFGAQDSDQSSIGPRKLLFVSMLCDTGLSEEGATT